MKSQKITSAKIQLSTCRFKIGSSNIRLKRISSIKVGTKLSSVSICRWAISSMRRKEMLFSFGTFWRFLAAFSSRWNPSHGFSFKIYLGITSNLTWFLIFIGISYSKETKVYQVWRKIPLKYHKKPKWSTRTKFYTNTKNPTCSLSLNGSTNLWDHTAALFIRCSQGTKELDKPRRF